MTNRAGRHLRILFGALLVLTILADAVGAQGRQRRERYIDDIYVIDVDVLPPVEREKWDEVARRDDLKRVMGLFKPNWRNLWFPVQYKSAQLAADTAAISTFYRNLGYLEARVATASTEPAGHDGPLELVDVVIVLDGIADSVRYRLLDITFEGVTALDTIQLATEFASKHPSDGAFFSPAQAIHNVYDLGVKYGNAGFLDTESVRINQSVTINRHDRTVIERYHVEEIRPYIVTGMRLRNDAQLSIDTTVITDALYDAGLAPGNLFSRSGIVDAENYLLDLNVLSMARVTPDSVDNPSAQSDGTTAPRRAVVDISERQAGDIRGTVGWSSVYGWRAEEGVYYHNFLRKARTIGQESEVVMEPGLGSGDAALERLRLTALYGQPRLVFPRWLPLIGGNGYRVQMDHQLTSTWEDNDVTTEVTTRPLDGVSQSTTTEQVTDEVRTRQLAWTMSLSRRFGASTRLSASIQLSRADSVDVLFDSGVNTRYSQALILRATYDTRRNYLRPTDALVLSAQVLLSDPEPTVPTLTVRPELLAQVYHPLSDITTAALSINGGLYHVSSISKYTIPDLFWRSQQTPVVRGLSRDDLTGQNHAIQTLSGADSTVSLALPAMAYVLGRAEIRIDPWEKLGATLFVDAARAWTPDVPMYSQRDTVQTTAGQEVRLTHGYRLEQLQSTGFDAIKPANTGVSVGFGPRFYWVLPIRLDFAWAVYGGRGWRLEFGIGQAF